jgi:hypothetical protein
MSYIPVLLDFIVTCGAYSNSADIAVVINIGLTGDNGDEW